MRPLSVLNASLFCLAFTSQYPVVAQVRYHTLTIADSIGSTASEPSPDAFLLSNPVGVEVDNGQYIRILDAGAHSIYTFNTRGELVQTSGRRGSGPLEFMFGDAANAGLLKSDQQGNFFVYSLTSFTGQLINSDLTDQLRTYHFQKFVTDAALGRDGRLYVVSRNRNNGTLIDMHDKNGNYLASFGDAFLSDPPDEANFMVDRISIAVNGYGELLSVHTFYPLIRLYTEDGALTFENLLDLAAVIKDERLKKKIGQNPDPHVFEKKSIRDYQMCNLVRGVCSDGEAFYLLLAYENLVRLDRRGRRTDIYELAHGPYIGERTYYALDFAVSGGRIVLVASNGLCLIYCAN